MNNEFKVGDFVYSPREGYSVYEVVRGGNENTPSGFVALVVSTLCVAGT